jgi:hypothetical protein
MDTEQNVKDIDKIANITENDKLILKEVIKTYNVELCKNLSFYSHRYSEETLDNYIYIKTYENEPIYITNCCFGGAASQICIDVDFKLIFGSRYWFDSLHCFIQHLLCYFIIKDKLNLNNTIYIGENIIAIQRWFSTYGHFLDEQFNLCDFMHKFEVKNNKKYKILYEYEMCDKYKNYPNISNKLFKIVSSVSVSTADKQSSSNNKLGFRNKAREILIRCFCPPLRFTPRSPNKVSNLSGNSSILW